MPPGYTIEATRHRLTRELREACAHELSNGDEETQTRVTAEIAAEVEKRLEQTYGKLVVKQSLSSTFVAW